MTQPAAPAAPVDFAQSPPEADQVNAFHRYSDKDVSPDSDHHTLGTGIEQASPGDHNHDGKNSKGLATNSHFHDPTAWTTPTLLNAWVSFGPVPRFRRLSSGLVIMTGAVSSGTNHPNPMFTLPAGFRPIDEHRLPVMSNGVLGWISVFNTGNVGLVSGSNTWVDLSNIKFYADM